MKVMKTYLRVNEQGGILLPAAALKESGLKLGDEVEVTLVTELEGMEACSPHLIIVQDGIGIGFGVPCGQEEEDDSELSLPKEWLDAAGIPEDSDLEVACAPGVIMIREEDRLERLPDELKELFARLEVNPDTVREVMKKEGYFA